MTTALVCWGIMADPRDEWTPFRWLRWKRTGDPLTEHEQYCVEMWADYVKKHGFAGINARRALEWDYYSKLRQKYPPR